jgi:hypothetical protein
MEKYPHIHPVRTAALMLVATLCGIAGCASTHAKTEATPTLEQVAASSTPAAPVVAAAGSDENPYPGTTLRKGPDGEPRYCVKEIETGQRIAKERCYTALTMQQMKESQRERIESMRENSSYGTSGGP